VHASAPGALTVRGLTRADLPHVAEIHLAAFPDSSMTSLGWEAVRRHYRWLLEGPHEQVALGAFAGDTLAGYSFGGIFHGALTGFLRANAGFLAWRVLTRPWLAANPMFRDNIGLALRLLRPKRASAPKPTTPPMYGILSIAVDPARHGQGVGQALMRENLAAARARGFARMVLTVAPTNTQAIRFYEHDGWQELREDGTWHGAMTKDVA